MREALRKVIGVLLLACLLAPGAQAQAYAQTDKLSLEALTAPPPGGSGGHGPVRRRAARGYYHYRGRSYAPVRHYYSYRSRGYRHGALRTYGRHAPSRYGYAPLRRHGVQPGYVRRGVALRHAFHAVHRSPASLYPHQR